MFDLGWAELLVIVVVAVLAIGPKELPTVMHALGRMMRRMQYMKFALSRQFDDFMLQHDLDELRRDVAYRPSTEIEDEKAEDELVSSAPLPRSLSPEGEREEDVGASPSPLQGRGIKGEGGVE